jgi:hypothetical protein
MRHINRLAFTLLVFVAVLVCVDGARAQTTTFTYQGRLTDGGNPANGNFDLQFALFDNATGGAQIGSTLTRSSVAASGGVFSVQLDFGVTAFPGANRFLEISVRPSVGGSFMTLSPRQQISSTPYAIRTLNAGTADALSSACVACVQDSQINSVAGSKVTGAIPVSSLPGGSTSYVQNGSATQNASFNVSGSGTIGGLFRAGAVAINVPPNNSVNYGLEVDAIGTGSAFSAVSQQGTALIAQSLQGGRAISASTNGDSAIVVSNSGANPAVFIQAPESNALAGYSFKSGFAAVYGENIKAGSFGVYGTTGTGGNGAGVFGSNTNGAGVWGRSTNGGSGVYGEAQWPGGKGVYGFNSNSNSSGVYGQADAAGGVGVFGTSTNNTGVYGSSGSRLGVWGNTNGTNGNAAAVYGDNGQRNDGSWAGYFNGPLGTSGRVLAPASALFIDHPLDPQHKYLQHSLVASPEMLTIYSGTITVDDNGEAIVTLPSYFEALNQDYRYQLTAVGAPGPNIYIAEEIKNNRFKIAGGSPGAKVSWQVTGVRHDAFATQNRIQAEEAKPADQRSRYLNPGAYGQADNMSIVSKPSLPSP